MLGALEAVPLSPTAFGVLFTVALLFLHVFVHAVTGRLEDARIAGPIFWERPGWWTEVVNAALLGYLAAMIGYGIRGAARDLEDLRPVLRGTRAELAALERELTRFDSRPLLLITACFVIGATCVAYFDPRIWPESLRPPVSDPVFLWVLGRHVLLGFLLGQALGIDVALTRRFSRIGEERVRVDLFDMRPLAPFARRGLRTVLLYAIGTAIFSLFWLSPSTAGSANFALLILLLVLATAALVLPVRGVHRSIRRAKQAELDWVRRAIRADLAALRAPEAKRSGEAAARLPALLDAEARVQSVREWPFDLSTLVRFTLYVMVGIGSWLGAALVERLLGAALD
jgi:hypothetical protein